MSIFDHNTPYDSDIELFNKLGFDLFDLPSHEKTIVGTYEYKDGSFIRVSVTCLPAMFWEVYIYCAEDDTHYGFTTGSGALSNFWNSFELFATGMICHKTN